jgi:hypothetical protein
MLAFLPKPFPDVHSVFVHSVVDLHYVDMESRNFGAAQFDLRHLHALQPTFPLDKHSWADVSQESL